MNTLNAAFQNGLIDGIVKYAFLLSSVEESQDTSENNESDSSTTSENTEG